MILTDSVGHDTILRYFSKYYVRFTGYEFGLSNWKKDLDTVSRLTLPTEQE